MIFDGSVGSNGRLKDKFTIRSGFQGAQGAQGATGSQGAQGAQGLAGIGPYGCRVSNTSGYNLDNDVATALTWDTDDYDPNDMHSTSSQTNKLIAPVTGKYIIWVNISWEANASGRRLIYFSVNGGADICDQTAEPISGVTLYQSLSWITNLTANDFVEVYGQQSAGVIGITPIMFGMRKLV